MSLVSIEKKDGIALLTIDRADALNALSRAVLVDLETSLGAIEHDAEVGVVILTGAGQQAFCGGADIPELASLGDAEEGQALAAHGQRVMQKIEDFSKPVIAAVNGFALGGGCELAMACHIRVAVPLALFGLPEVTLGLIPGFGGTQRLARLVGRGLALELILTGDKIQAERAYEMGLVNLVVKKPEVLLAKCRKMAKMICSRSPLAIANGLKAVAVGLDQGVHEGGALEARLFGEMIGSHDGREGLNAFMEKRPAKFTGR